jgi:glycosyltransferase involved in cell wall biosynthesis
MTIACVIPTYNSAHLLRRAIDSVLAQTRRVDEVIVVDDGSTDNTREVVASYGSSVQYFYQENKGGGSARNHGVEHSKSDWIAFLDADDEWLPTKIERQAACLTAARDAVLCYGMIWHHQMNGVPRAACDVPPERLWPQLRISNWIIPSVAVVRKDVFCRLGGFRTELRSSCEDWELFTRMAYQQRIVWVAEPLINYYEVLGSASQSKQRMIEAEHSILDSLLIGLRGPQRILWRRRITSMIHYRAAIAARSAGQTAFLHLFHSLRSWPSPFFQPVRYASLAVQLRDLLRRPAVAAGSSTPSKGI